jgi:nicotinate-nucleotide adenylyltransferase
MRIAFFGGSFDPPHLGHLAIARAAQQTLQLDQVFFAPVGLQALKPAGASASFEHRAAMTQLAIAGQPNFCVSLADAPTSTSPNYTAETLEALRQTLPAASQLFLLIGADAFLNLRQWHRAEDIPFLAHLIVASRPGEDLGNPAASLPPGITLHPTADPNRFRLTRPNHTPAEFYLLPNLEYDISATQLRQQIQSLPSTEPSLLPQPVLDYIHQHHLYTSP